MSNEFEIELEKLRGEINEIDDAIYRHLLARIYFTTQIGFLKKQHGVSEMSETRRNEIYEKLKKWAIEDGIPVSLVTQIYDIIFEFSVIEQILIITEKDN
jgi:chorismate mutase